MKKVQVLGPGCKNCQVLYERTTQAAQELGLDCSIEKVTDLGAIVRFNILSTPALVVDGDVKISGRVPAVAQIKEWLR